MRLGMSGVNTAGQACQQAITDMKSRKDPLNKFSWKYLSIRGVCDRGENMSHSFGEALIKTNLITFFWIEIYCIH